MICLVNQDEDILPEELSVADLADLDVVEETVALLDVQTQLQKDRLVVSVFGVLENIHREKHETKC